MVDPESTIEILEGQEYFYDLTPYTDVNDPESALRLFASINNRLSQTGAEVNLGRDQNESLFAQVIAGQTAVKVMQQYYSSIAAGEVISGTRIRPDGFRKLTEKEIKKLNPGLIKRYLEMAKGLVIPS